MYFFKSLIKNLIIKLISYDLFEKKIFLEGQRFSFLQKKLKKISNLSDAEFSVFSQWGDDGIINWLIDNLKIKNKFFIEIGVQDYKESNTRFLLKHRNWTGCIIEGNKNYVDDIKKQSIYWKHDLKIKHKFINKNNINSIIKSVTNQNEIGLLSLDIDGVDYWIWKEINSVSPIIFVCEFNSVFGDLKSITVPYNKMFDRTRFHYSNLGFGASLKAFINISKKKGYIYLGTNSNGVNAYFVKKIYYKDIRNKIKNIRSFCSKTRESRDKKFNKNYLGGIFRSKEIENIDVIDLNVKKKVKLKKFRELYSKNWRQTFKN